jgi:RHH-type rel operon transcriptional repressor/antitoxin RelB
MLSLRLDPDIEGRLAKLAKLTGHTKSYFARQLIESNLEDLEDRCLAEARLESAAPRSQANRFGRSLG